MLRMIGFDLDGTLADTVELSILAFRRSVSSYVGRPVTPAEVLALFGLNETGMVKALAGPRWREALADFYLEYTLLHNEWAVEPFPGVPRLLRWLKDRGVRLALITGKGERGCAITLEKLELDGIFDWVLWGEEQAPNKNAHIARLLETCSVEKEAFCYVGDMVADVEACRRAGVTCLSAAWQPRPRAGELESVNPGRVFYRVADLRVYLKKMVEPTG